VCQSGNGISGVTSFLPSKRNGLICSVSYPLFYFRLYFDCFYGL
jgi:hypothetical protein